MKKIIIILCLCSVVGLSYGSGFLTPDYDTDDPAVLTQKKIDYLRIAKSTRNIGYGLFSMGFFCSMSSMPLFAGMHFEYGMYLDNYRYYMWATDDKDRDADGFYQSYKYFETAYHAFASWGSIMIGNGGIALVTSLVLFMVSTTYEQRADMIHIPGGENERSLIPAYIAPLPLYKKIRNTGLLLTINGSYALAAGIIHLIYYRITAYLLRDAENCDIGHHEQISSIVPMLTIGGLVELTGIIMLGIAANVKRKTKSGRSQIIPDISLSGSTARVGLKITL